MKSSSPSFSRQNSELSTKSNHLPSLSISTTTSCDSSMYSTSPTSSTSPYYSSLRLEKRPHSISVHRSITTTLPQRSASTGSTLLKESNQRWDDSQLAMELADDNITSKEGIRTKVRQWMIKKQHRRSFHQWLSDIMT
ncbi:uncharacterized protein BX664DRAFT_315862 [Halteromyces radiatus]|uniref:uncharacterized protein n=1 Tax=Halteromyces radiatus TaxID=101107 RepID=UPI00221FDFD0|nr:uncharacterized protein BX664DRAFT_315862 [Halteromyces radiatus]KAI8086693.1 hypothetical protein BX664DRAFT_315862 [Halteromyces radiatus]